MPRNTHLSEDQIQATIIEGLRAIGYMVWSTTVRGWRGGKGYGTDKGIPDLLVAHPKWGPMRMALEVKGPTTRLSAEQAELHGRGLICVARSLDDAVRHLKDFENRRGLHGPVHSIAI